ncbi:MAG: Asp-tRNA(Asn)/Glu-tRNA(Gln) amidotransferase subunit GatC [Firmicutes bacterium]|nr:Asp-tRNA(Asn)/Glu-tRNA(Gln) amidotransferase subunit GatC [Bacillota bacterium]
MLKESTPDITPEEVEHIAHLSRIEISEEDKIQFAGELGRIIHYINKLSEVDTTGVDPTFRTAPIFNVFREDTPRESFPAEEILANAPEKEEGCFRMPRIIGG